MKQNLKENLFIVIAFLLGSINILYGAVFYILLLVVTGIFIEQDFRGFVTNVKKYWKYLILPLAFVGYLILHYLISLIFGAPPYKVTWSRIELLVLYFFFIPLYIVSAKNFVTSEVIKRSLLALCWGTILFNFTKLFYLTGFSLFAAPAETLDLLYSSRFGCHLAFWGGYVYLEPQAVYLSITAIISYFFIFKALKNSNWKLILNSSLLFVLSLWFLSLTVTKGAILAFFVGFVILSVVYFHKLSLKSKLVISGTVVVMILVGYLSMPVSYTERIEEVNYEIENLQEGEWVGGSIVSRVALYKECFSHFNQWGIFGLGVYKNAAANDWFTHSQYSLISHLRGNVHNSFLEFWMIGGILGLFFMLYYFFAPVWHMIKQKKYSFLLLAILSALFISNNTAVLIIFVNSHPLILYLLAMSYFYLDQFVELEKVS